MCARASFIDSLTGGLPDQMRLVFRRMSEYYFNSLRLGRAEDNSRSENFQLYAFSGTTSSVAGQEFTIQHGLGTVPYLLVPCLDPSNVNEQLIPLQVSRAADTQRVYLKSTSTGAAIRFWLEAP